MTLKIFLFVLIFIEFVVNLQTFNDSTTIVYNTQYHIADNLTGVRTKRKYTRWGGDGNTDASVSQFIVRVYDEEPPTTHPAIQNIMRPTTTTSPTIPFEDLPGKLQLGSVKIPVKTQSTEPWKPAEVMSYSRFMQLKPESATVTGSSTALDKPDNLIKDMPFPRFLSQMTIKKPQVFNMTSDPLFDDSSLKVPERSEVNWSNVPGSDDARDVGMFDVNDQPKRMPEDESLLAALGDERVMDFTMHEGQGLVTPVKYNRRTMQGIVTPNPGYRRRIEDGHFELDDGSLLAVLGRGPVMDFRMHEGQGLVTPVKYNRRKMQGILTPNPGYRRRIEDGHFELNDFNLGSDANSDEDTDGLKYSNVDVKGKPMSFHNHISDADLQNVDDIDDKIDDVKIETEVNGEMHEFEFTRTLQPGVRVRPTTKIADSRKSNKKVVRPPHEPRRATHSEDRENEDIDIELYIDKEEGDDGNENVRIDAEVDGNNKEFRPGVEPRTRISDSRKPIKKVVRPPHEPKKVTHSEQRENEDIYLDVYINNDDGENGSADVRIDAEVDGEEKEFEFTHTPPGARAGTLKPNSHNSTRIMRPSTRHPGHRETEDIDVDIDIDEKGGSGNEDIKIDAEVDGVEKEFEFTHNLPGARAGTLKPNSHKSTKIIRPSTRHPGHRETEDIDVDIDIDEKGGSGNEDIKIDADVDGEEKEFEFTHTVPGARAGTFKPNPHKSTRIIRPSTRHPGHRETEDIDVDIDIDEKEGFGNEEIKIDADVDGKEKEFEFTHTVPGARAGTFKPNSHKSTRIIRPSTRHTGHRETEDIDVEIDLNENEGVGNERQDDMRIDADVDGVEKEFEFTHTPPGARSGTLKPNSHKSTRIIRPSTRHPGQRETEDIDVNIDINEKDQGEDIRIEADVDGKEAEFNFTNRPPPDHHSTREPNNQHKTTKKHVQPPREPNTDMIHKHGDNNVDGAHDGADDDGKETTASLTYPGHTKSPHNRTPAKVTEEPSMYSDNEENDTHEHDKHKAKTDDQPKGQTDDDSDKDDSEHNSDEKKVSSDESDTDKEGKIDIEDKNTSKSEEKSRKTTTSKPDRTKSKEMPTLKSTSGSKHSVVTDKSEKTAKDNTLTTQTTIVDIDEHNKSLRKSLTCNVSDVKPFTFLKLHKLEEVMGQIKKWGDNYPVAKTVDIANGSMQTYMGNTIIMLIVDDKSQVRHTTTKNTVLIVAGIQGRDHHSVAAAMYLLYELIERGDHHTDLLAKYRFWVIPIFNPDGYQYSMSFPNTRNWRKNLKPMMYDDKNRKCEKNGSKCITSRCKGVHLDRNFDYQWVEGENVSQLNDPCSDLYPGPRQLSEPETRILTRYLSNIPVNLHAFIALKEGDVLGVMFPYSHTKNERTTDFLHRKRAQRASMAATTIAERRYVYGQTSQFLPLYAGGIEDWMEGHLGVENSYSITLNQPNDASSPTIKQVCHEGFAAINTLLLTEPLQSQLVSLHMSSNAASPLQPCLSFDLNCFTFKLTDRICSIPWFRMFVCYVQLKLLLMLIADW